MSTTASAARSVPRSVPDGATSAVDVDRPILICGVGRSGTSLLQSMLNAHPSIAIPAETHFFRRHVAPRRTREKIELVGVNALVQKLRSDELFARINISPEDAVSGEQDGALDLLRVYRNMLELCAERDGKQRVGDKDPRNLDFLPELATAFPDAAVLHIIRDPRAVVHSRMRAAWSAGRPWRSHALIAQEQLRRGRRNGHALFGSRYLEIRYEDLVTEPVETLSLVCAHVDVPFDPAMLDFGSSARKLVAKEEMSWKKETLGPLLSNNGAKWREGLEPAQVAFIEGICIEAFDNAGYEREMPRGGVLSEAVHGSARSLARLACALRRIKETRR